MKSKTRRLIEGMNAKEAAEHFQHPNLEEIHKPTVSSLKFDLAEAHAEMDALRSRYEKNKEDLKLQKHMRESIINRTAQIMDYGCSDLKKEIQEFLYRKKDLSAIKKNIQYLNNLLLNLIEEEAALRMANFIDREEKNKK